MRGLVGLKPTYGRVSRYGLVAFASSLDQVGPFGRTVADAALMLNVIAGHDPRDATSAPQPVPDYLHDLDRPLDRLRVGIAKITTTPPASTCRCGRRSTRRSRSTGALGREIVDVSLPHTEYGIAAYYVIAPSEASSNLARYDGVHFGHRTKEPVRDILELFSKSRAEASARRCNRIMIGTYALSEGYGSQFYVTALKIRALIARDFDEAFTKCDVILTPTSPSPAFQIGQERRPAGDVPE